jgi:small membrane protein
MKFQPLFALATCILMFYFLTVTRKSAVRRMFVFFVFGAGLAVILYPELAIRLAHMVGVGRGADLVFYVSILFLLFLCFNFYVRFQALDERFTSVVRTLAISHPAIDEDQPQRDAAGPVPPPRP